MIHWLSKRPGKLVTLSAGEMVDALSPDAFMGHEKGAHSGANARHFGFFQEADKGTLFIDEVGVDVQVVVATNKDLRKEISEGRFQEDIHSRFSEHTVRVPPLRVRTEDIPELAQHFVNLKCRERKTPYKVVTPGAAALLKLGDYPRNLRDLRSVVYRAVVISGEKKPTIEVGDIQAAAEMTPSEGSSVPVKAEPMQLGLDRATAVAIGDALTASRGRVAAAAELLGVSRATLHRAMVRLGMGIRRRAKPGFRDGDDST
jgi:DNA-binding NtrC family response regulator